VQFPENLVRCPKCKSAFCARSDEHSFSCTKCAATYPVSGGVVDLIPELKLERSRAQALMEWPPMVKIYEGRLWRRSFWQGDLLLGISFDREEAIILREAKIEEGSTVLDLACASGIFARTFARIAKQGRVVGLDLSLPMVELATRKAADHGLENLTYLRGTAQELPFEAATFDVVNCCGALHLFPDVSQALQEIGRVLKPGGRFTTATFRRRKGVAGAAHTAGLESIGVNSHTPDGLKHALSEVGLGDVRVHHDSARWMILSSAKQ
jgi:SAM-dependent methyltransferase